MTANTAPDEPLLLARGLGFSRNEEPVFGPLDFRLAPGEALLDQLRADLTGLDSPRDVYSLPSLLRERGETLWALGRWREAGADLEMALAGLADRDGAPRVSDASVLWRIGLALAQAADGQVPAARASLARAEQLAGQLGPVPRVGRSLDRGRALNVAVNVSPSQFTDPHFCDDVLSAIEAAGIPAELLSVARLTPDGQRVENVPPILGGLFRSFLKVHD